MSCSGVRNRMYRSTNYGSTVVWQHGQWMYESDTDDGSVEVLTLVDPNGDVTSSESRITIEFGPREANSHGLERIQREIDKIKKEKSDFATDIEPRPDSPWAEGTFTENGTSYRWLMSCSSYGALIPSHIAHLVFIYHQSVSGAPGRSDAAKDITNAVRRTVYDWPTCHDTGVLEVQRGEISIEQDPVIATLHLADVDLPVANFDVSNLFLVTIDGASGVREEHRVDEDGYMWAGAGSGTDIREIPSDTDGNIKAIGTFRFSAPRTQTDSVIYRQGDRFVTLASYVGDVGASGRPRINPGG